jgi:hypothetical protein
MWSPTENDEKLIVTLENVKFVPALWINLFSIEKALKNGFNLSNHGEIMELSKGNVTLTFDKAVRKKNGLVPGIKLLPVFSDFRTSVLETKKLETIDVNILHKFLVIAMKLMLGLLEKHMVMKLTVSLISVKLVQLEKQGRKASTKN